MPKSPVKSHLRLCTKLSSLKVPIPPNMQYKYDAQVESTS